MRTKRAAFTLTELLVVLALIALLGALLAFVMPSFRDRSRAAKGGQAVQGWVSYARQRAMYEQAPRGVRFMFAPATLAGGTTLGVVECQYLEQPDDYIGGPLTMPNTSVLNEVKVNGANFSDGSVEPGDSLEILGNGLIHHINSTPLGINGGIQPSDPVNFPNVFDKLILDSNLPNAINSPITNYRIIRKPRVTGDESMKLPNGIIIDLNLTFTGPPGGTGYLNWGGFVPSTLQFTNLPLKTQGYFDVMFAPSGTLLETGGSKLILWVRTQDGVNEFDGNPTLIVVYTGSGTVAAYDPNTKSANPYALVR